ncbi:1,3-beta-glucan synthase component FKS3 [Nakaseomyces bracarensis]|uniref:1,3-beta-glucan synthase n=1 Tax=Nakaseomyces bracarensis TaxID=273131 RepID=A0ABR4NRJ3_9SACH
MDISDCSIYSSDKDEGDSPFNLETVEELLGLEYPTWSNDDEVPITRSDLLNLFDDLSRKFGFQENSKINMYHLFLSQLDSRASRTTPHSALVSLHVSYIGGEHANFRKWYFAAQLDLDEELGYQNMKLHGKSKRRNEKLAKERGVSIAEQIAQWKKREQEFANTHPKVIFSQEQLKDDKSNIKVADYKWKLKMNQLTPYQMARQIALYLLCWGEANQLRLTPECLCYIFKCAWDYDEYTLYNQSKEEEIELNYLNDTVTPIYNFLREQLYERKNHEQKWKKRPKDHRNTIGYDDINQLFWYPEGIERIRFIDGKRLVDIPKEKRYIYLKNVMWEKVFYKTYRETRSWMHCITNFNRFWIIHLAPFWFFTSFNSPTLYTKNYVQLVNNQPTKQARLSVMAFGGTITCLIQIFATIFEWQFVPRAWPGAQRLTKRILGLIFCLLINFGPSIYIFGFFDLDVQSQSAYILSICQFITAIITTLFFAIQPLGGLFGSYLNKCNNKRRYVSSQTFTASFPKLSGRSRLFSIGLWLFVFLAKYIESYFFLTLSIRDPIRVLSVLDMSRCRSDVILGTGLCRMQATLTLILILLSDLCLFFLDTYLWYIICNCIFSIVLSFSLGLSSLMPWKNVYSRLPKRLYSKLLANPEIDMKYKPKVVISQVWNAIVVSMYREHLISIEHLQKLLFQKVNSMTADTTTLRSPTFFIAQDDSTFKSLSFFPKDSDAKRRISFFAQSLSTPILEPVPVDCIPSFTVLIPHYSEKILFNLREIIKEETDHSKITVLEYLKYLHPHEWDCYVKDTKILSVERKAANVKINDSQYCLPVEDILENVDTTNKSDNIKEADMIREKIQDMPFRVFGFCSSESIYTLRTRIWASLRSQTLYRTVSGFMNYAKAIKLLYNVENSPVSSFYIGSNSYDKALEIMSNRKFKMVVAMQRYAEFSKEELEGTELLLKAYPNICISYLLVENRLGTDEVYYSCLTNGYAQANKKTGLREPIYKVKLSGNPILGDGKSDNQNHSIIFYRGEYIQVVDANQDNYLEECLKIRSILREFEEFSINTIIPYIPGIEYEEEPPPVAIVGAREYIFSENVGVLGDIAAGKEQTFGTLFARTLAEIGAKLHYGHPDFINGIFMTTRGGLSKAQKGLHLNEDIYGGMNAICRGGKIKHSDYYQCGKGRDLGFNSILNFTTKIGAGMGEQLLSREYYYLGTQLPIDRFLSFFYAHPGFHLNNMFISISLQLFFLLLLNLGAINHETIKCHYDKNKSITSLQLPLGCYNLMPALHWIAIFVFSIFIVFFIAFAPLLVQELLEKGILRSTSRIILHLLSMAPLFEVFVCQVYSSSLLNNMTFGDAKYIPTGRGFAINRVKFALLYSRFSVISIYTGIQIFLMLLFATTSMWLSSLLWFWITVISLCFAPFLFNPHQFSFIDFFLDYRNYLKWLFTGNSRFKKDSWVAYTKHNRARITGYKNRVIDDISEKDSVFGTKTRMWNIFFSEILLSFIVLFFDFSAYIFINAQTGVRKPRKSNSILRLIVVAYLPVVINMLILVLQFLMSIFIYPVTSLLLFKSSGNIIASFTHILSVIIYLLDFELMCFLEGWSFTRTLMLLITSINLQLVSFRLVTILLLTKELRNNKTNLAWWTGRWHNTGIGWRIVLQPFREFIVKTMEMTYFSADFFLGHFLLSIQSPITLFPFIDYWHSMLLFWLRPTHTIIYKRPYSRKALNKRRKITILYFFIFLLILIVVVIAFLTPYFANQIELRTDFILKGTFLDGIVQPRNQYNNDTGTRAPATVLRTKPIMVHYKTFNDQ